MVEGCPEGVDIRAGVGVAGIAPVLFQGRVEGSAAALDDGDGHLVRDHLLNQAEVDQFDHTVGGEFQVARFDVAVDDGGVLAVQVFQRIGDLPCPQQDFGGRQELVVATGSNHQRPQVIARNEIHHQVVTFGHAEEVRHFGQIGVVQASQQRGFPVELLAALFANLFRKIPARLDFLHCAHAPVQAVVLGQVNRTHTAAADDLADDVALTEQLIWGEWRRHNNPPDLNPLYSPGHERANRGASGQ